MAVTKTLTTAVPYNLNSKVQQWDLGMTYNQGSKSASPPTYYESEFSVVVPATDDQGNVNFTPKAEGSWTLAQLTALCPVSQWDDIFASQYDSVITNPPDDPVPDPEYVIPS
jgi:hypothetical protein|tara:strand:- start:327 stop:662 length:336 start_codon:yes stop_codon:yes gene_type:complete